MKTIADYLQELITIEQERTMELYSTPAKSMEEYNKRLGIIAGIKIAREKLEFMMNTKTEEFNDVEY